MIKIMNESILFSLGFLSQNSLWKLFTFRGYKGIYSRVYEECEKSIIIKQGILATQPHDWNESRANYLARLEILSYNATVGVTLQLPLHDSHMYHSSDLPVARSSRETLLKCILLELSSHTTLT